MLEGAAGAGPGGTGTDGPLVDAGAVALARLVPTWPMDGLPLPGVVIDHIVTSPQVRSRGYSVLPVAGIGPRGGPGHAVRAGGGLAARQFHAGSAITSRSPEIIGVALGPAYWPCGSACSWLPAPPGG